MPRLPIDIAREELLSNPREFEYLDFGDTSSWSENDKQEVVHALLDAAAAGDSRVPVALFGLMPREWLRKAFEQLLTSPHLPVRIEAGYQLQKLVSAQVETALEPAIEGGQLDEHSLRRAVDLMLLVGDESAVRRMMRDVPREDVRTVIIDRLWSYSRLDLYPQVWWSGLGLLKTRLMVPLASFRAPLIDEFDKLSRSGLVSDSYPPQSAPLPPALVAAIQDVDDGRGPIADSVLAPLDDDQKQALAALAAKRALTEDSARGVAYVARLTGAQHRDLFEWAAARQNRAALAQAGRDALAALGG
jgi:hypothetical protein